MPLRVHSFVRARLQTDTYQPLSPPRAVHDAEHVRLQRQVSVVETQQDRLSLALDLQLRQKDLLLSASNCGIPTCNRAELILPRCHIIKED